jgi:hypothetical protein
MACRQLLPAPCHQVDYVMQVTGRQLSEELLELLPDYELAWTQHTDDALPGTAVGQQQLAGSPKSGGPSAGAGNGSGGGAAASWGGATAGGVGVGAAAAGAGEGGSVCGFVAYYRTASTQRLNRQYGDLMYRMRDLEVRVCWEWCKQGM